MMGMMGMLRRISGWFGRLWSGTASGAVTPERLAHMLAFAKANNAVGQGRSGIGGFKGIGENIGFQADPCDIDFRQAHGRYRRDLVVHSHAHVQWAHKPIYAAVGLVDGAVQYRFGADDEMTWWASPVTRNPVHIAQIERMFDAWYEYLGLPGALDKFAAPPAHEPVDRSDKMALIRRYLDDGDRHFLHDVLGASDADDIILWVDWREDEVDIVTMCEGILRTGALSACYRPNDISADLEIAYRGKMSIVRYPDGVADRDTTLLALNAALAPDFEIRYCVDSDGSDTAALLPLRGEQWAILEADAPEQVGRLFRPLSIESPLFT